MAVRRARKLGHAIDNAATATPPPPGPGPGPAGAAEVPAEAAVAGASVPPASRFWLLDIDGTLVVTDDLYFETFKALLAPLGHVVDEAFYAKYVHGKVDRAVFSALLPEGERDDEATLLAWSKKKDDTFCEMAREKGGGGGRGWGGA